MVVQPHASGRSENESEHQNQHQWYLAIKRLQVQPASQSETMSQINNWGTLFEQQPQASWV